MTRTQIIVLALVLTSSAPGVVVAQVPAGGRAEQVPVVEGVEKPESPKVDQAQGNAKARLPQVQQPQVPQVPQVEMPPTPQQPKPPQD